MRSRQCLPAWCMLPRRRLMCPTDSGTMRDAAGHVPRRRRLLRQRQLPAADRGLLPFQRQLHPRHRKRLRRDPRLALPRKWRRLRRGRDLRTVNEFEEISAGIRRLQRHRRQPDRCAHETRGNEIHAPISRKPPGIASELFPDGETRSGTSAHLPPLFCEAEERDGERRCLRRCTTSSGEITPHPSFGHPLPFRSGEGRGEGLPGA